MSILNINNIFIKSKQIRFVLFFFFFVGLGFDTQGLSHTSSPFCSGYFGDGVSQIICLAWPQTMILPNLAKIIGKSHRCLAKTVF
jgi:hypothetical protein